MKPGPLRALLAAAALAAATGCTTPTGPDGEPVRDPYEGSNRAVFGFNEGVDRYVLNPIAEGWEFVTFEELREAIGRFYDNLGFPRRLITNLGQAHPKRAGVETGRFLVNSTIGLLGFFDPAARMGLRPYDEDFGQMFGDWGIGSGPYWTVPFLGPSNPRDFTGGLFDMVTNLGVLIPFSGPLRIVNERALRDEQIEEARETALDFYVFVRDGYLQRRDALVADRNYEDDGEMGLPDSIYELEDEPAEPDEPEVVEERYDPGSESGGETGPDGTASEPGGAEESSPGATGETTR